MYIIFLYWNRVECTLFSYTNWIFFIIQVNWSFSGRWLDIIMMGLFFWLVTISWTYFFVAKFEALHVGYQKRCNTSPNNTSAFFIINKCIRKQIQCWNELSCCFFNIKEKKPSPQFPQIHGEKICCQKLNWYVIKYQCFKCLKWMKVFNF